MRKKALVIGWMTPAMLHAILFGFSGFIGCAIMAVLCFGMGVVNLFAIPEGREP